MKYAIHVLLALLVFAPAGAQALDASFAIFRKGDEIGTHTVTVRQEGEQTIAETEIEMKVKLGFIPVFRYR
ncbi:MAG: DUF6134 family protein, partial [Pseudomonadota bacterium]